MRCDCCDIDLGAIPFIVGGRAYCCEGCAEGGPCVCSYERPGTRFSGNGHSDPEISEILLRALREADEGADASGGLGG